MIRRLPLLVLAIGTMALAACGGGDDPDPNAPCESHSDCAGNANGEWCTEDGRCVECAATVHCDSGLFCDMTDNTCVACRDNLDCGGDVCDPETRSCVQCLEDNDCGVWSLCDTDTKTCNDLCATDDDRIGNAEGTACDRTSGACVPCMGDGYCASGEKCDLNDHTCYADAGCESSLDCIGDASGPGCDTATGHCLSCLEDAHCGEGAVCSSGRCVSDTTCQSDSWCTDSICDEAAGTCVECLADSDCTYSEYATLCDTNHSTCVQCLSDADCEEGYCDAASGACESCASDDNCTDPLTPSCIKQQVWFWVINACGCKDDASCQDPSAPFCHDSGASCVECKTDEHCTNPDLPICHAGSGTCVECLADTDCSGNPDAPFCDLGTATCTPCLSALDCTDPAAPACVRETETSPLSCGSFDACTTDDAAEPDDGPAGAVDITPADGETTVSVTERQICALPDGMETDWYKFTAAAGDSVSLSLNWTAEATDLDMEVMDIENDRLLGKAWFATPEVISLTYLPAGTYYVRVRKFAQTQEEAAVSSGYTFELTRTQGGACTSVADCAAEYQTQNFRGSCNAETGACEFIPDDGQVALGGLCDSHGDCGMSGDVQMACTYGLGSDTITNAYIKDAHLRSYCIDSYCASDADCGEGQLCHTDIFNVGICLPACTEDAHCLVNYGGEGTENFPHLTCNVGTGKCEVPQ